MRYFTDELIYELQKPTVAGRKDPNENNLAGLFLERVFAIAGENSYVAQVLPGVIFNGSFSKDLRLKLLDNAEISALIGFENHGIFDGIENRYNFAVTAFKNSGRTDVLRGFSSSEMSQFSTNGGSRQLKSREKYQPNIRPKRVFSRLFGVIKSPRH